MSSTAEKREIATIKDQAAAIQNQVMADSATVLEIVSRAAADPNTDIDKLERLMGMYERISAKNAEAAFYSAFADMQSELPIITERGEIKVDGNVRSRYAKNEDIQESIKPILKAHGFMLNFRNEFPSETTIKVIGVLAHKAGHSIQTEFQSKADTSGSKNSIQALASSQSYGQRYVTNSLLNIISRGADDDGNRADQSAFITAKQAADLNALVDEVGANRAAFLKLCKVETFAELPADKLKGAIERLEAKRKGAK